MTLPEMVLTALSLVYGGVSFAYVRERLRQRHEHPVLDLITFPCILIWSLPFAVYWLVRRALLFVLDHSGSPAGIRERVEQGWGIVHAAAVGAIWLFLMVRVRAPGSPLLPGLALLGVVLPLEVYLSVPERAWKMHE
ncbi:MAG: hypothetical protein GXP31_05850 [Kiritimatiellaeota bacterium]|nr:hypothetical protein [Kiritimatiellota bacterium]